MVIFSIHRSKLLVSDNILTQKTLVTSKQT